MTPAPHPAPALVHIPVMLAEVMAALDLGAGAHMVDGTFGAGGYSRAALARGARVTAFDRDPRAIADGERAFSSDEAARITFHVAPFSRMADLAGPQSADAVALDLGFSSLQMDDPSYGLSFRQDGPLDMRLSGSGETAADWLNRASEEEIADVLYRYGEEPAARRIARAIVSDRPFTRTAPLAALIRRVVRARQGEKHGATDPATRSFQAIRIRVNDELAELEHGLAAAEQVLKPGGRLAVVSFHSLEDRIVKRFLRARSAGAGNVSRHLPVAAAPPPAFERPWKAERPGAAEIARNPRARSATLRVAERAPARKPASDTVSAPDTASKRKGRIAWSGTART